MPPDHARARDARFAGGDGGGLWICQGVFRSSLAVRGSVVCFGVTCYKTIMPGRPPTLQPNSKSTGPHGAGESGSTGGDETHEVDTVVFALIPEFQQVKVRDREGRFYALTSKTRGVDLLALYEGQRIVCVVTRTLPRVVHAQVVA